MPRHVDTILYENKIMAIILMFYLNTYPMNIERYSSNLKPKVPKTRQNKYKDDSLVPYTIIVPKV